MPLPVDMSGELESAILPARFDHEVSPVPDGAMSRIFRSQLELSDLLANPPSTVATVDCMPRDSSCPSSESESRRVPGLTVAGSRSIFQFRKKLSHSASE